MCSVCCSIIKEQLVLNADQDGRYDPVRGLDGCNLVQANGIVSMRDIEQSIIAGQGDRIEAAVCTQICIKGNEWLSAKVLFGNDFSVFGGL